MERIARRGEFGDWIECTEERGRKGLEEGRGYGEAGWAAA